MTMMKSPFKFLDSFTLADRDVFFGRDHEITELYSRVFESKILLVYGVSGTGKSSLINCGLASRFDDSDWLPVNVRRGSNIIESLNEAFNKQAIQPLRKDLTATEKLKSIYLDHFKPVFMIFDQFEELFIFGDKEERKSFVKIIKSLLDSDLQCRMIFVMREEYMAGITEFEHYIPTFFANRVRIEKMSHVNALEAIKEPCKVFNILLEEGFSETLLEKLSPGNADIELTYLQVFLDKIFRLALNERELEKDQKQLSFTHLLLNNIGDVSDLLGSFLDEQIKELEEPETGLSILKAFVSIKGTKNRLTKEELGKSSRSFGKDLADQKLTEHLQKFVNLRILRDKDENGKYELRHDSLASKIYEKITLVEKETLEVMHFIDNALTVYEKRGKLLTYEDLKYLAPYEDKLFLNKSSETFINKSKNEITRSKRRRRNIAGVAAISLIIILSAFTFWALSEKQKSNQNYLKARANNFNYLSKETVESDPTIALRFAEYAISIDSTNQDYLKNLLNIYSNNSFYKIVSRDEVSALSFSISRKVAFSPDGKSILIGSYNNPARLCDLNGNLLKEFNGTERGTTTVAFSPDSKNILITSFGNTARLLDLQGNVIQIFKGHEWVINSVAFSPDGKSILTGSDDKTARLWDLHGNVLKVFKGHESKINSVAFSPDGKNILTGSSDKTARLWDLQGNVIQVFKGHEGDVVSVSFSPDAKNILTGSFEGTARLWDLKGNEIQNFIGHEGTVFSVAFSPDGKSILTGSSDKTARRWNLNGDLIEVFRGHEGMVTSVVFSPDGKSILTNSLDNTTRLWKLQGNQIQVFRGHKEYITSVAFSPDGKSILTGSNDKTARLWNLQGQIQKEFKGSEGYITSVAFSPDGKSILTSSWDKNARLWDLQGNVIQVFEEHKNYIPSVAFSPDGKSILISCYDSSARLWDLHGNVLKVYKGHIGSITSIAFSPDGKNFLTGSYDMTARLWDLQGNVIHVFKGHEGEITSVAFSPDGKNILTGSLDKTVRLWDLQGNVIQEFKGHVGIISSIAFSPNGKCILTGSTDNGARLWDLHGNLIQIFSRQAVSINSVAFSPDGKSILTGAGDKTAQLWEVKESYKEFQCGYAYQELSIEQKLEYGIIEFSEVLKMQDEKTIYKAAEYYFNRLHSSGKDKKPEYLNNAEQLFHKGLTFDTLHGPILRRLTELSFEKNQLYRENTKKEIDKYFNLLLKSDDLNDLFNSLKFYVTKTDSSTIPFGYSDKAISIGQKLWELSLNDRNIGSQLSYYCTNLSMYSIYCRQYKNSLAAVKIAINADSTKQMPYTNLPLAYLFNDMYKEAEQEYNRWKDKPWTADKQFSTFREVFLEDITDLESRGITHPDFAKVKELLKK